MTTALRQAIVRRIPPKLRPALLSLRDGLRRLHIRTASRFSAPHENPVYVLGNQKSGTTVIAALLARASEERVTLDFFHKFPLATLERLLRGDAELTAFFQRYSALLQPRIVKEPDLTFLYPQLRRLNPTAKLVFVVRDPRQNVRSILDRLELPGDRENLATDDARRVAQLHSWRLVISGELPPMNGRTYIENLALRWNAMAQIYLRNRSDFQLLRYEDFLLDKPGAIAALAHSLGMKAEGDLIGLVDRQFQPRGRRGVDLESYFGPANLSKIESLCGDSMCRLGYTVPHVSQSPQSS